MRCYLSVEGIVVGDIEGDWSSKLDSLREFFCAVEGSAGWRISVEGMRSIHSASDIPTDTSMPASLRMSKVGLVTKPEPLGWC